MVLLANRLASRILGRGLRRQACQRRWISASQLTVERSADDCVFASRPVKEDLVFGTTLSEHMLMVEWDKEHQWGAPRIVPYQDLKISPAASSLHYGRWFPVFFGGADSYRVRVEGCLITI
jgi:hypothetical protein